MDENKNHPIRILTDHMADLVIRLIETERQLEEEKTRSENWWQNWQRKDAQLRETEAKLAEVTEEHQKLKDTLDEFIKKQEGATKNDENN